MRLKFLKARQVLDSRGNPTIECIAGTKNHTARAIVPSGASTGIYEAVELRDKTAEYHGKAVRKAMKNIDFLNKKLKGYDVFDQTSIDLTMKELDGTKNKQKLGANAMLAVSMAVSRLAAKEKGKPYYEYLAKLSGNRKLKVPVPFCNVINGGKHAGNKLNFQEFMIAPTGAKNFEEAMRAVAETYQELKKIIEKDYGKEATNVGDEGGFAPPIKEPEEAIRLIEKAIARAGYKSIMQLAMDPAASEFYRMQRYDGKHGAEYQIMYKKLVQQHNIISIEDPFDQDDFEQWEAITENLGEKIQVVGDDLTVSNPARITEAIRKKLCNALLLKVNQIGTLSEAIQSANLAKGAGWNVMVSHRSGETEDTFIADFAVALGCGQIKLGAPCRGERTAKYNQLLRISEKIKKYGL